MCTNHIHTNVNTHSYIQMCTNHIHTYVNTHTYIDTHVYTHTHIHSQSPGRSAWNAAQRPGGATGPCREGAERHGSSETSAPTRQQKQAIRNAKTTRTTRTKNENPDPTTTNATTTTQKGGHNDNQRNHHATTTTTTTPPAAAQPASKISWIQLPPPLRRLVVLIGAMAFWRQGLLAGKSHSVKPFAIKCQNCDKLGN